MFTFKTIKQTGKWASFYSPEYEIKLKKKVVGRIYHIDTHSALSLCKIHFMIYKKDRMEDGNPNCDWRWYRLKRDFPTVDDAKDFLNKNFDELVEKIGPFRPDED